MRLLDESQNTCHIDIDNVCKFRYSRDVANLRLLLEKINRFFQQFACLLFCHGINQGKARDIGGFGKYAMEMPERRSVFLVVRRAE